MHDPAPVPAPAPLGSSLWLHGLAHWYDDRAKPTLAGLAIISSATAVVGYAAQFESPSLEVYLRCIALGFALWLIARTFWAGAWLLPALETKRTLTIYSIVAVLGFSMFATVSTLGSLGATGGGISEDITRSENTDRLSNAGQEFAAYIGEMAVSRSALLERRDQANTATTAEVEGRGPTGIAGTGPVANALRASQDRYAQAADLLGAALSKARTHVERIAEITAEMRALLALDPARSISAAAAIVANGVPEPSRARASSRARIADIRSEMESYARTLQTEVARVAALTPMIPELTTLSPAERLIGNMWRMPGLTMAALLLDLCGWIAIGFRLAIYEALKARTAAENARPVPQFITLGDFTRVEHFVERAQESRRKIEDSRPHAKRGRPPIAKQKGVKDDV